MTVEDDGEAFADVLGGRFGEGLGADAVEGEADGRTAVLILAGRGLLQVLAVDQHLLAHGQRAALLFVVGQQFGARRHAAGGQVLRRQGLVDHLERHLGRLADDALQLFRVALARRFDDDAVAALADDGRFLGAQGVDPLGDDAQGGVDGARGRLVDAFLGQGRGQRLARLAHRQVAAARAFGQGRRHLADERIGLIGARRIGDRHRNAGALGGQAGEENALFRQLLADVFDERGGALLDHGVGIDFQQQIRAALQVETEVERLRRQEAADLGTGIRRQEVRQREQDAEDNGGENDADLPAGQIHHWLLHAKGIGHAKRDWT